MINKLLGIRVHVSGDTLRRDESALLLLNHPTHLDWVFGWAGVFQAGWPHAMQNVKFVMKEPIKKVPGLGKIFAGYAQY